MLPSFELWDPPPPKRADKALTGSSASFNTFTADLKVTQEINQCELAWHYALQGQRHVICYLFNKTCLRINWFQKILVQFCYLRLCLGIETVSCRLLLRMARITLGARGFMRGFRFCSSLKKWPAGRVFGLRPNTCRPAADETKLPVAREKIPLVPRVSKDGHGLKLEKIWPTFSSFNAMPAKKITKKLSRLVFPDKICWYLFHKCIGAFCVWLKVLTYDFCTKLTKNSNIHVA